MSIQKTLSNLVLWGLILGGGIGLLLFFAGGQWGLLGASPPVVPVEKPELEIPVSVMAAKEELLEITYPCAGMLKPFEQHRLGFEMGGRIVGFNAKDDDSHLDEGDRVKAGQIVARLDNALLVALRDEAAAKLELAQSNHRRAEEMYRKQSKIISDRDYEDAVHALKIAKVQLDQAETNLDHSFLRAPVDGIISKRYHNPGTTVAAFAPVVEVLELDRMLLKIGVPESRYQAIRVDQPVHLRLVGTDLFGQPLPSLDGKVYRVGETAEEMTGLFEIEVLLKAQDLLTSSENSNNPEWEMLTPTTIKLRPGLIARAEIVLEQRQGFRFPADIIVHRQNQDGIFYLEDSRAKFYPIPKKIEQKTDVILPSLPSHARKVIVGGQHRLIEDSLVQVIETIEPAKVPLPTLPDVPQDTPTLTQDEKSEATR
ncbi:Hypothetical protein PBC10988_41470 [Planctomycetales bacterium 10988]|nr:Hypothetical protein PBC10988_41470 [Planctomycetales bacterium 10988]